MHNVPARLTAANVLRRLARPLAGGIAGCFSGLLMLASGVQAQTPAEAAVAQLQAAGIEVSATRLVQFAAQGDLAVVNQLLAAGVKAGEAEPQRQVTALQNAAAQGQRRIVLRLLELGADVNAADWHGVTPLIAAVSGNQAEAVQLLLQKGANVNHVPARASTALITAVRSGNPALVQALLQAGAAPGQADVFDMTPLNAAQLARRENMVQLLQAALKKGQP